MVTLFATLSHMFTYLALQLGMMDRDLVVKWRFIKSIALHKVKTPIRLAYRLKQALSLILQLLMLRWRLRFC